jgi:hypothetical protein
MHFYTKLLNILKDLMKKIVYISLLIFSLNNIFACDRSSEEEQNKLNNNEKTINNSYKSENKEISAVLDINKKPIIKLEPVELKLILKQGKEVIKKANVTMDLTMPSMTMPKNIVKMKESLAGIYNAQVIFTMSGDWRIYVKSEFDGKKQDMYFDIKVK